MASSAMALCLSDRSSMTISRPGLNIPVINDMVFMPATSRFSSMIARESAISSVIGKSVTSALRACAIFGTNPINVIRMARNIEIAVILTDIISPPVLLIFRHQPAYALYSTYLYLIRCFNRKIGIEIIKTTDIF